MTQKLDYTEEDIRALVETYSSLIFRISYCILSDTEDAKDATQDTFLKYLTKSPEFNDEEHRKAWLIKVATNISKNMHKFHLRRVTQSLSEVENIGIKEEDFEIFELIMSLPTKYKIAMTLYYVEGYRSKEIAEITGASEDAVRKRLQKGRELLKREIEKEQLL